ncbi:hypothetical protein [Streptomyces poonensis]|uniref:Uncharacterized protein n=1 Tax=Streptomyces poonensis TaxID=68255 RepID=A0A918PB54_9ACTN|nr:hypothetical protein [Streptomyces poonensis]GGY95192.1 hypothetical protein GCM10010365_12560 [Streptomyces poonensis]GLJ88787.1 hypothetical protein GCM10017589_13870 [Streptomyces poonensis]
MRITRRIAAVLTTAAVMVGAFAAQAVAIGIDNAQGLQIPIP